MQGVVGYAPLPFMTHSEWGMKQEAHPLKAWLKKDGQLWG
jgi:hypothetical protein